MDLSIIIVNYKTYELTFNVINSILDSKCSFSYDVFVVDNHSADGSLEKLKDSFKYEERIKFIESDINGGFAYGNNLAIKKSEADYILLLNSDTLLEENTLEKSLKYIKNHENIGALGVQINLADGTLDKACKRSFPNPTNSLVRLFHIPVKNSKLNNYNLNDLDNNGIYEIDCLTGAYMLIDKNALLDVGLLDETFFMYGEDIDLCYRIKKGGYKIVYYGKSKITHFKGSSSKKQKSKLIYEFYRAMYIFYRKNVSKDYFFLINILVYIGIGILLILKLFINIFKRK